MGFVNELNGILKLRQFCRKKKNSKATPNQPTVEFSVAKGRSDNQFCVYHSSKYVFYLANIDTINSKTPVTQTMSNPPTHFTRLQNPDESGEQIYDTPKRIEHNSKLRRSYSAHDIASSIYAVPKKG